MALTGPSWRGKGCFADGCHRFVAFLSPNCNLYKRRTSGLIQSVASKRTKPVHEKQLHRWRLIREFKWRLAKAVKKAKLHSTWKDPQRLCLLADYLSLFLLGVYHPILDSMRGLCRVSRLQRVQQEVCGRPVSRSSFSEAQAVVEPELLKQVYDTLAEEVAQRRAPAQAGDNRYVRIMQIVDSSLWHALPRMQWALWRQQGCTQQALRLHVSFQVLDGLPSRMALSAGKRCERLEWEELAQPGDFYVGDRNYGEDYALLGRLDRKGCFFAVRLRSDAQWVVQQELALSPADRQAGVLWQGWVRLGKAGLGPRVRVVQILGEEEQLLLATNLTAEQLSAELVSLCYRQRWLVELFFRWLKHLMKADHWLAESEAGVALQIYLTLIAAQLLLLFSGQRPNKRAMELLQFMMMGWASPEEVLALLAEDLAREKKKS